MQCNGSSSTACILQCHLGLYAHAISGLCLYLYYVLSTCFCCAPGCAGRYGARLVIDGDMTIGDLNSFMLYALFVGSNAGMLAGTFASVVQAVSQTCSILQAEWV